MSTLSELYDAMETLRNVGLPFSEEQEKRVSELEEELIKNEVLPVVTQSIAPALRQVRRELVIVVDYVPDSPISVRLSRKRKFTADIKDAIEILPDPPVEYPLSEEEPTTHIKSNVTRLRIILEDGTVIQRRTAAATFTEFVMRVGAERVRSLKQELCGQELVSRERCNFIRYRRSQKPLGNGLYLLTYSSTIVKKHQIDEIAQAFNIKVKVEII